MGARMSEDDIESIVEAINGLGRTPTQNAARALIDRLENERASKDEILAHLLAQAATRARELAQFSAAAQKYSPAP